MYACLAAHGEQHACATTPIPVLGKLPSRCGLHHALELEQLLVEVVDGGVVLAGHVLVLGEVLCAVGWAARHMAH